MAYSDGIVNTNPQPSTGITTYGDVLPRTAAHVASELLKRAQPLLVFEQFMQGKTLPANNTKSIVFRRYNALPRNVTALVEGVTPTSKKVSHTDVGLTLNQYGDLIEFTDVAIETHEDQILKEFTIVLAEQAAQSMETMRYYALRSCTNKFYSNGTARAQVNTPVNVDFLNKIRRGLHRQNAQYVKDRIRSSVEFNTENVLPSYVVVCHPDLMEDMRGMRGFTDAKNYGPSVKAMEGEVGAYNEFRFICTTICTPYPDAGGAFNNGTNNMVSTNGTSADVYPLIVMGKNSWGGVALKGEFGITPYVVNPKPSAADPLGQRGFIGWKSMQGAIILNDAWMAVAEVACTELS